MIPPELLVAVLACGLSNYEAIILAFVLAHRFGPPGLAAVRLDPKELESLTGVHRNNVRRAVLSLEAGNLLARLPDGAFRFLDDWARYAPGGKPFAGRLGGTLSAFVRGLRGRLGRRNGSRNGPIQVDSPANLSGLSDNPSGLPPQSIGIAAAIHRDCGSNDPKPLEKTSSVSLAGAPERACAPGIELREFNSGPDRIRANAPEEIPEPGPGRSFGSLQECVELALELFGDATADAISRTREQLVEQLDNDPQAEGPFAPRWDLFARALEATKRATQGPQAVTVRNPTAFAIAKAQKWIVEGFEPFPAPVPAPAPRLPGTAPPTVTPPVHVLTPERRAELGAFYERQRAEVLARAPTAAQQAAMAEADRRHGRRTVYEVLKTPVPGAVVSGGADDNPAGR